MDYSRYHQALLRSVEEVELEGMPDTAGPMYWSNVGHNDEKVVTFSARLNHNSDGENRVTFSARLNHNSDGENRVMVPYIALN